MGLTCSCSSYASWSLNDHNYDPELYGDRSILIQKGREMNELIGISMALVIGVVCRVFNLPLPAPPNLQGSLLVLAVTLGFMAANYLS
tara:strand:- start:14780 stop:15043 length:264 start_codon:yes stop_codon:yes gene_type:complete